MNQSTGVQLSEPVLANEEVVDGKSEIGGHPVEKRPLKQWVLKITDYAERLLEDLDDLDWPASIKEMQRRWIGKSHGANVTFQVEDNEVSFEVFTTRPDTLFGVTFCVLAPEHPLVAEITSPEQRAEVEAFVRSTAAKSELERTDLNKDKSGVALGAKAINPVNGEAIPIFIADYVLASYGHGAIMGVPGHDSRDHEFATKYDLSIRQVVVADEQQEDSGSGTLVNSAFLDGLSPTEAIHKIGSWLEEQGCGESTITYKLRDWLFSRQRYWGEPFPLAHDSAGNPVALNEDELPVLLPDLDDFKPSGDGSPPLAKASDWLLIDSLQGTLERETNVMPQWAGSCWYYLRYLDPNNDSSFCAPNKEQHWMPVDLYVGGGEHAVLHLLYARFWHKVLYDLGLVSTKEPFKKLVNQGMILGENGEKMSKSRGNVVNPDDIVAEYGADSLRLYEMFMGPLEARKPWQSKGVIGVHRFLKKAWRLVEQHRGDLTKTTDDENASGREPLNFVKSSHKMIKKVTEDTENLHFNTAIAAKMEWLNGASKESFVSQKTLEQFVLLLAPYSPHMAEELWSRLGHQETLAYEPWPTFDAAMAMDDMVTLSLQVNGKPRDTLELTGRPDKEFVLDMAKKSDGVARHLVGKTIRKEIYVPGRIVNFVVGP